MPKNPPGYDTASLPSAPTMSGLTRPSIVGPWLLNDSIAVGVAQFEAPTASMPTFELSPGERILRFAVAV